MPASDVGDKQFRMSQLNQPVEKSEHEFHINFRVDSQHGISVTKLSSSHS